MICNAVLWKEEQVDEICSVLLEEYIAKQERCKCLSLSSKREPIDWRRVNDMAMEIVITETLVWAVTVYVRVQTQMRR